MGVIRHASEYFAYSYYYNIIDAQINILKSTNLLFLIKLIWIKTFNNEITVT